MSGPISVLIIGDPIAALLAAAGIRAAEGLYDGYARAAALRAEHAAAREATHEFQGAASQQGRAALLHETEIAEARFEQLIQLSERFGAGAKVRATRPVRPESDDFITLAAYTRALQMLAAELQNILLTEAARLQDESVDQPGLLIAPDWAEVPVPRTSQRLLARIAHLGPPPADLAALALELDDALPGERASLLATELRMRIQAHIEAVQQRLVQEATATILRQSLMDLGYEVEAVVDTLFVEGGVVHFQKAGWGDYMVRMRVEPKGNAANFNVIRAVVGGTDEPGEAGERAEPSVLDHLAEDRWCAEFPALLHALEMRGVRMNVTRRLDAGEAPVQRVERGKLPRFAEEDARSPAIKLLARALK